MPAVQRNLRRCGGDVDDGRVLRLSPYLPHLILSCRNPNPGGVGNLRSNYAAQQATL
jgi:hypothetical protein